MTRKTSTELSSHRCRSNNQPSTPKGCASRACLTPKVRAESTENLPDSRQILRSKQQTEIFTSQSRSPSVLRRESGWRRQCGAQYRLVQTEAAGTTFDGQSISWHAIVSTPTTNAIDHIGASSASSIPVYLVDGKKVADSDNTNGLWSGSLLSPIFEDINGNRLESAVWTGTNSDGTRILGETMGGSSVYAVSARSEQNSSLWIHANPQNRYLSLHLYGISDVLTVPAPVPEPSTAILIMLGGFASLAYSMNRKRN